MTWDERQHAARLARAAQDANDWRERWGAEFTVSSGSRMCSPMISMPDGSQVHRSHLLFMRQHGLVEFEHLARGTTMRVL